MGESGSGSQSLPAVGERAMRRDADALFSLIASTCDALTGERFCQQLVRSLAEAMGARYAFICEYIESARRVRDLAFWAETGFQEPGEYDIEGTPCAYVLAGEVKCYPQDVADLFPRYKWLREVGAQSYLAVPLKNRAGTVLGHMGIMDVRPLQQSPTDLSIFQIFGARACAELERQRFAEALRASEECATRIVDSALDAIITFDAQRHIELFNPAAERVFGCAAAWAIGQPIDRFLTATFRNLVDSYVNATEEEARPRWTQDGLTALRANREQFPVEGTLAAYENREGQKRFSLILRDVNERMRTRAELNRLSQQNEFLQEEIKGQYKFEDLVGETPVMQRLREAIAGVASADTTVLIHGETGTGKEQVAHATHALSRRRDRVLVKMNCAALPSELIESELFGHEKGAFTGALAQRKGRFEMADGGSLFLDEVGELSPSAQAKLLRVLQEQEFERVGGTHTIRVDVRVIAATNRKLGEMVKEGSFRADLYYRLNVFPLEVPPLRERAADIPALCDYFLQKFGRRLGKSLTGIEPEAMQRLQRYPWPGNIRELQNVIERAAVLGAGPILAIRDTLDATAAGVEGGSTGLLTLEQVESAHIGGVLRQTNWRIEGKDGAAAVLGLEPSTLRYRMQKLGIRRPSAARGR